MNTFYELYKNRIKISESGCWEWTGSNNGVGYGQVRINGKNFYAHRISAIMTYGEIPEGKEVCHKCDNPSCVNPDHLFYGTRHDNVQDMMSKKRHGSQKEGANYWKRGEDHWTRVHPERLATGTKNGRYTHPEKVQHGEDVGTAKLTWEQVRKIRHEYFDEHVKIRELAKKYHVVYGNISFIIRGLTWKE
jgi:HNH endonuclease